MDFDSSVLQVAIEDIIPNRFQPRLVFEDKALQELSDSIKEHGIIQPLVLRRVGEKFEIIAGERRYKAATMAGLTSVPAVISQADDRKSAEAAVVENVQRKDLSAIEEAKSYKALLDQGYMSQEQLAKKMGLSQSAVSNKLRLLALPEEVQQAVMEQKISERHARSLLSIKDSSEQIKMMKKIIDERLTVRQLDEIIKMQNTNNGTKLNVDEIRAEAEDIKFSKAEVPIEEPEKNPFDMGVISLGQKKENKFFNTLEDEAANMQMTEAVNPFSGFSDTSSVFASTTAVDTQINKAEKIEENVSVELPKEPEQALGSVLAENEIPSSNEQKEEETKEVENDVFEATAKAVTPNEMPKPINEVNTNITAAPIVNSEVTTPSEMISEPEKPVVIDTPNPDEAKNMEPPKMVQEMPAPPTEQIDTLDSLDFEPPKQGKDITPAIDKVNTVINELKAQNYKVEAISTDLVDQVTFTITIKKED